MSNRIAEESRVGGALVIRDLKIAKKAYRTPTLRILDLAGAKAELEMAGSRQTADTRQMLSALNQLPEGKKFIVHSASRGSLP